MSTCSIRLENAKQEVADTEASQRVFETFETFIFVVLPLKPLFYKKSLFPRIFQEKPLFCQ